jgi:hypothetical protein
VSDSFTHLDGHIQGNYYEIYRHNLAIGSVAGGLDHKHAGSTAAEEVSLQHHRHLESAGLAD